VEQTDERAQSELIHKRNGAVRIVSGTFTFTLLLVVLALTGVMRGLLSPNPSVTGALGIAIVILGVGAITFRRTRFSSMRLRDIAALRGVSGLLETLYTTTICVALIGGVIALLGFVISMMTGVGTNMLYFGVIAVVVLFYAYPRRSAWQSVVAAFVSESGGAGQAAKGTTA
jgi:hypothetical protein